MTKLFSYSQSVFLYILATRRSADETTAPGAWVVGGCFAYRFDAEACAVDASKRSVGFDVGLACISREAPPSAQVAFDLYRSGACAGAFGARPPGHATEVYQPTAGASDAWRRQFADSFVAALPDDWRPAGWAPEAEPAPARGYSLNAGRQIVGPSGLPLATLHKADISPTEADRFARQIIDALNAQAAADARPEPAPGFPPPAPRDSPGLRDAFAAACVAEIGPDLVGAVLQAAWDLYRAGAGSKSAAAYDAHHRLGSAFVSWNGGPLGFHGPLNPDAEPIESYLRGRGLSQARDPFEQPEGWDGSHPLD